MIRKDFDELREKYDAIFDSEKAKAQAFDAIAENYYLGNFGSMQKSDIDVLMFSLYIEGILNKSEDKMETYSDYTLAKQLGIPQSRVSTLKVKKELQYPYSDFKWERSFQRVCGNARYEDGKIRINLRDKNLYYELKNQIEKSGSYVETTLTSNLLVVSPDDFLKLSESIMSGEEVFSLKEALKKKYFDNAEFCSDLEKEDIVSAIKRNSKDSAFDMLFEVLTMLTPSSTHFALNSIRAIGSLIVKR